MRYIFAPFVTIGIVFIILGINGQRTFLPIGIVFVALGPRYGDKEETTLTVGLGRHPLHSVHL